MAPLMNTDRACVGAAGFRDELRESEVATGEGYTHGPLFARPAHARLCELLRFLVLTCCGTVRPARLIAARHFRFHHFRKT